jgi:glycosyltransferase involved in cell wall biosynthesis
MRVRKIAVLATHPIQYYAPIYRYLANRPEIDIDVFFAYKQDVAGQARAGFGVGFDWDVPLTDGYSNRFLSNRARKPDGSAFFGCNTPDIDQWIANGGYDALMVHGWYSLSYIQAIRACWRKGVPVVVRGDSQLATPRSWLKKRLKEPLYRYFVPRFDAYLVVGERARAYLLHYGADPARMFFSPHCVDNRFFHDRAAELRPHRAELRSRWDIREDCACFLFAGKLIDKKRPLDLIRAADLAMRDKARFSVLMTGDGPLRSELELYVRERGLPVRFTGFLNQQQMPEAYAAADAIVLPSDAGETWGLVTNEAMASGLPAIVSDAAGCGPDLIRGGVTGAVFPCGSIEDLAALLRRWSADVVALRSMGANAGEHVQRYSVERAAAGIIDAVFAVNGL